MQTNLTDIATFIFSVAIFLGAMLLIPHVRRGLKSELKTLAKVLGALLAVAVVVILYWMFSPVRIGIGIICVSWLAYDLIKRAVADGVKAGIKAAKD
jgi:hypothetical protein